MSKTNRFYLLGPNVKSISEHINKGLKKKSIEFKYFNKDYPTVATNHIDYSNSQNKEDDLIKLCNNFSKKKEQSLIYCQSPKEVQKVAEIVAKNLKVSYPKNKILNLCNWLSETYHPDWSLIKMLEKGIGIHHANLPRALSQYLVYLFNNRILDYLICTSTIIEGVNTTARNIVIWNKKLGQQDYDLFTFNNIAGRAGRMLEHFIGNVYRFNKPPDGENLQLDFPLFNQKIANENLLLSLDNDSLTENSKKSVDSINLGKLNRKIIKLIQIDKRKAVDFANTITEATVLELEKIKTPYSIKFEDLQFLCKIIWDDLLINPISLGSNSVKSFKQLAYYILELKNPKYEPNDKYNKTADDSIFTFIAFQKNWAGHHLPVAIRSLEIIINHVFPNNKINLEALSSTIENFYCHSFVVTLDEYGLPMQIGEKYQKKFIIEGNFQGTLNKLKDFNTNQLSGYEKDSFEFVKNGI